MLFDTVNSLCHSQKITIAQLERNIHVGSGSIQKWKRVSPGTDRLAKVADYFGVSTDFLLGREMLSSKSRAIAEAVDNLSPDKQDLIRCYIKVIQKE